MWKFIVSKHLLQSVKALGVCREFYSSFNYVLLFLCGVWVCVYVSVCESGVGERELKCRIAKDQSELKQHCFLNTVRSLTTSSTYFKLIYLFSHVKLFHTQKIKITINQRISKFVNL